MLGNTLPVPEITEMRYSIVLIDKAGKEKSRFVVVEKDFTTLLADIGHQASQGPVMRMFFAEVKSIQIDLLPSNGAQ